MPSKMEEESSCCPFSPSSLWEVIVKCDDICFTHVLPRLNRTDLKFLYDVNGETRALVKRSSRAGDLKEKFKTAEMSSISTLEVAWEHKSLWGSWWEDHRYFCSQVAKTNKLELLKWIREEKKCLWDSRTITAAAIQGNLEMVKYCVANECLSMSERVHMLPKTVISRYSNTYAKKPKRLGIRVLPLWRLENGHLHILEYLVERKYDKYNELACWYAAENGHLDCLKYLHETAKAPWDYKAVRQAHYYNHTECLQYLLDNNCPLPFGWRYEHGELERSS